ncbi:MAG: hypothetical protein ACRDS1_07330 [Pseudonocardiaceae bacterium]
MVEAMTALPAILAGLFILALAILILGLTKSGLAAGLAISVMMRPIIIRGPFRSANSSYVDVYPLYLPGRGLTGMSAPMNSWKMEGKSKCVSSTA